MLTYNEENDRVKQALDYFRHVIFDDFREYNINCWIAGGMLRAYFANEKLSSDFDVFFPDEREWEKANDHFYGNKVLFENDKTKKFLRHGRKIDLIKIFFESPEATIEEFDFTVTCAAIDYTQLYCNDNFFIDLSKKSLVINKLPYPLSTLQRLQKYIRKGYHACNGTLLEIAKSINKLNMDEPTENTFEFYPDGSPRFVRFD